MSGKTDATLVQGAAGATADDGQATAAVRRPALQCNTPECPAIRPLSGCCRNR
jgi:hypothetical protein